MMLLIFVTVFLLYRYVDSLNLICQIIIIIIILSLSFYVGTLLYHLIKAYN